MNTRNRTLRGIHIILLIISVPYAFVSWLSALVPGIEGSLAYSTNLFAIAAYDISAVFGIIIVSMKDIDQPPESVNIWLCLPFVYFAIGIVCCIRLLIPNH